MGVRSGKEKPKFDKIFEKKKHLEAVHVMFLNSLHSNKCLQGLHRILCVFMSAWAAEVFRPLTETEVHWIQMFEYN